MAFADEAFGERPFSSLRLTTATLLGEGNLNVSREFRIFSATEEYVTLPNDSLPTQPFFGTLVQPISFTRSLLGSDIIGNYTTGTGELDLANTDGGYDFLIQRFAIDGRGITVKVGTPGDSYDNFYTVFDGVASDWTVQEDIVKITLVDNSYKLAVTVQPNLYGGTGGVDGTTDLVGKRKPRSFGFVKNVSPPLVIPSSLVYQVNDGPVSSIGTVYDRGVALTPSSNYATVALLVAATIPAGNYATCNALGFFRLNSSPTGTVTADLSGDISGGTFVSKTSDIVRRIIGTTSSISDPNDLYLPSFTQVAALQPASVGYWVGPDDTNTVADVLSDLMGGIGGWAGFRRNGKLEVGIFQVPTGLVPSDHYDKTDVIQIKREALPSSLTPPPYRFRVAYQHNWTVQTDVAGAVSATQKSFLAQADRYAESTNTTVLLDHPFARDRNPTKSFFNSQTDAQTESDRLLALYKGSNALYRITLGVEPFALDLGDVINVTYPRWDLTVGRNLRIVEMTENAQSNTIEVVGFG
jgi:hypothetical protein